MRNLAYVGLSAVALPSIEQIVNRCDCQIDHIYQGDIISMCSKVYVSLKFEVPTLNGVYIININKTNRDAKLRI